MTKVIESLTVFFDEEQEDEDLESVPVGSLNISESADAFQIKVDSLYDDIENGFVKIPKEAVRPLKELLDDVIRLKGF